MKLYFTYLFMFLVNEVRLCHVKNVLLVNPYKKNAIENVKGGILYLTNHRLEFMLNRYYETANVPDCVIKNPSYHSLSIMLPNILDMYEMSRSYKAVKKLSQYGKSPRYVKRLQIVCKDFNTIFLSFEKHSTKADRKNCADLIVGLMTYAFPTKLENTLVFSDYNNDGTRNHYLKSNANKNLDSFSQFRSSNNDSYEAVTNKIKTVNIVKNQILNEPSSENKQINEDFVKYKFKLFYTIDDWKEEFNRSHASVFFDVRTDSDTAIFRNGLEFFTAPHRQTIPNGRGLQQLPNLKIFNHPNRPIISFYFTRNPNNFGGGILRSNISSQINTFKDVQTILNNLNNGKKHLKHFRVDNMKYKLPTIDQLATSIEIIRKTCFPRRKKLKAKDTNFLSIIEKSEWLTYVNNCLMTAEELAELVNDGEWVWIAEEKPVDFVFVISCLSQILLDPYCRTREGFEELIQREFVCGDHPFADRLAVLNNSSRNMQPVFLLFLDCVVQLAKCYPQHIEMTEYYLITLWEVACSGLTSTFAGNMGTQREKSQADPAWVWKYNTELFSSPSYIAQQCFGDLLEYEPAPAILKTPIPLDFWRECFFRYVPYMVIEQGDYMSKFIAEANFVNNFRDEFSKLVKDGQIDYFDDTIQPIRYTIVEELKNCKKSVVSSAFPFFLPKQVVGTEEEEYNDASSRDDQLSYSTQLLDNSTRL